MEIVTIEVTQDDIDKGEPVSSVSCPIALAVRRRFETDDAVVGLSGAFFDWAQPDGFNHRCKFRLPSRALQFIVDFDHGKPVVPFTFSVNVVEIL